METVSCNVCKKTEGKLLSCGGCQVTKYCSVECQKKDWPEHKQICKKLHLKSSIDNTSPKEEIETKSPLDNYEIIKNIGYGNFSEIFLVIKKDTQTKMALKSINKKRVKQLYKEKDVFMEKHCLKKLEGSIYVIKLFDTMQDELNLYITMEYVPGGELWEKVKHFGLPSLSLIKYFMAHIINALEYIHSKGIVHRDLKPENIILDEKKSIKLVDFGTARDLQNPEIKGAGNSLRGRRTFDHFVGTPQYMPPECIRNKDSNEKCDIWALGCILYQLFVGFPPFIGGSEYLIFQKCLNQIPKFYDFIFDENTKNLIELMLEKDYEKRITLEAIKMHPFFSGINFQQIDEYEKYEANITDEETFLQEIKDKITSSTEKTENFLIKTIEEAKDRLGDKEFGTSIIKKVEFLMKQGKSFFELEEFQYE